MRARLSYLWDQIHGSYWFLPALLTLGSTALAWQTLRLDAGLGIEAIRETRWARRLVYTGGAEGAREVLSTIAGSMITVAGVVFSITIVALTLASSQFGPRVLASFMRDRGNQTVLGTFIATFLFCLLVLRTIRSADEEGVGAVVPHVSVTTAMALAVISLGVLIYFIHHVSISIQAPHLVASLAADLHRSIDHLFPEQAGQGIAGEGALRGRIPAEFEDGAVRVLARSNGYVDAVDLEGLLEMAAGRGLLVRLEYRPGQFVIHGSTLARVWPPDAGDDVLETVRRAVVTDSRRTPLQDVEFPIDQMVEVAVRALSPGINDPFTAITCIDQLGAGLCHLASRRLPSPLREDARGELRLILASPATFGGVVDAALHAIRQNAGYHTGVYVRLLDTLSRVVGCVHSPAQLEPLLHHAGMIRRCAADQVVAPEDREDVERRHRRLLEVADRRRAELRAAL